MARRAVGVTFASRLLTAWHALRSSWSGTWGASSPTGGWWGVPSSTGEVVTVSTALTVSAVWAAVQCIAGDVGSLPLFHYQRLADGGKRRMTWSRLYRVLHDEFNPEMTAMVGRETLTAHALLVGNGYAEIQRNELGQVTALWVLDPARIQPYRETPDGPLRYRFYRATGQPIDVPPERIFHVPGLGWDGICGYSVITLARESLGVALASDRTAGSFFGNGIKHSGFFTHPKVLSQAAHDRLKEAIAADPRGSTRILEEGMTFAPVTMKASDAQFLESRAFSIQEVARWFGIPPNKLGDLSRATFSNIEEQNLDYVVSTLRRWLVRWEQECNRKLIAPLEKGNQFCEHLVDGLLRGNIAGRYAAYNIGRNAGFLSANDIREFENLNPIPGGDVYLVQGAMVPLDRLNDIVDAQVAPDPTPAPPPSTSPPPDQTNAIKLLVEDLRAEVMRRTEALEAGAASQHAELVEKLLALPADFPEPPTEALNQLTAAILDDAGKVDALPAQVGEAARAASHEVTSRLATDRALRDWQQATIMAEARRMIFRERAQLKRMVAHPEKALEHLAKFYPRFVVEGCEDLRPWLLRMPTAATLEAAVGAVLTQWAEAAQGECRAALANGGLGPYLDGWVGREDALAQRLLEVIHAE